MATLGKRKLINMNHPSDDVPPEEVERFWGKVTPEESKWAENLRKKEAKKTNAPTL